MNKIKQTLSLLLIASLALVTNCKDKDDDNPQPTSKAELLAGTTSKGWKLTAATATFGALTLDLFTTNAAGVTLPECFRDNIVTFKTDKTYAVTEGASPCTPDGSDSGTWAFNTGETQLTLTSSNASGGTIYSGVPITIQSLTASTLQGTASVTVAVSGNNVTAPVNFTFTAQ